jgi:hypothetical protein
LLIVFAYFLYAAPVRAAAPFAYNDTDWEGTSELLAIARQALGKERVEIVATLDYEKLNKADGVLILHPEIELDYDEISAFMRAGGRVAILDDYGSGAKLLSRFQIHRVQAPLRPSVSLRENPNLAVAVPAVQQVAGQEQNRHPVVLNVDRVVTNHPSALLHPNLTPVLKISAIGEPDATLAVTGIIVNRGRLFAMGDPSVIINQMLRYPGNRAFAQGLVEYLVEADGWGQRGGKLYLLSNTFRQKGHFGGASGALGELGGFFESARDYVADIHKNGLPSSAATIFAALSGLGALGWALFNATRTYRKSSPRYATGTPLVAQGGLPGRAAVLAAPSTDRALLMLELRAALLDGIGQHLGLEPHASAEQHVTELERRGALSSARLSELRALLTEFGELQAALISKRRVRVPLNRIADTHTLVMQILHEIDERIGSPR